MIFKLINSETENNYCERFNKSYSSNYFLPFLNSSNYQMFDLSKVDPKHAMATSCGREWIQKRVKITKKISETDF